MLLNTDSAIIQFAFVVADLDEAMAYWAKAFGAGPFFVQRKLAVELEFRGAMREFVASIAATQLGDTQLELIEVGGPGPSIVHDMFPAAGARSSRGEPGSAGLHHIAKMCDDLDASVAAMAAEGHHVVMRGKFAGTRNVFVDTRATMGVFTELYQDDEGDFPSVYNHIAAAVKGWNGARPVRELAEAMPPSDHLEDAWEFEAS